MRPHMASLALAAVVAALASTSVPDSAAGYYPRRSTLELLMRSARLRTARPVQSPTRDAGMRGMAPRMNGGIRGGIGGGRGRR
jgi:hypothetical protein